MFPTITVQKYGYRSKNLLTQSLFNVTSEKCWIFLPRKEISEIEYKRILYRQTKKIIFEQYVKYVSFIEGVKFPVINYLKFAANLNFVDYHYWSM